MSTSKGKTEMFLHFHDYLLILYSFFRRPFDFMVSQYHSYFMPGLFFPIIVTTLTLLRNLVLIAVKNL